MDRIDLQRLSREELIELVLALQGPAKTSRTSSKPPSTDKKEKRENSRPGGAKPGHEPHNRRLTDNPDEFRDHKPTVCGRCGGAFAADADAFIKTLAGRPRLVLETIKRYQSRAEHLTPELASEYAGTLLALVR